MAASSPVFPQEPFTWRWLTTWIRILFCWHFEDLSAIEAIRRWSIATMVATWRPDKTNSKKAGSGSTTLNSSNILLKSKRSGYSPPPPPKRPALWRCVGALNPVSVISERRGSTHGFCWSCCHTNCASIDPFECESARPTTILMTPNHSFSNFLYVHI